MPDPSPDAAASRPESPTPEPSAPNETPEATASATLGGAATTEASDRGTALEASTPEGTTPSTTSRMPEYKGEPLDAERGPGLGCFWIQIGLLTFFLIFTPLTVTWGWDPLVSGALLIFTLILLLFSGQTIIFLLRLVAADRRTRRAPLSPSAKPTVGQMEDADATAEAIPESEPPADDQAQAPATDPKRSDGTSRDG